MRTGSFHHAEGGGHRGLASSPETASPRRRRASRAIAAEVWQLIEPRRKDLALGLVLILISRTAGLVLPASAKFLIDDVVGQSKLDLLVPLVLAVLAATVVQGATSYSLTLLLSKAAQRMIAEMRRKVQAHVGRLPIAYYDSTKTGVLISRIMSDVEGVRNLVGTGLVQLIGGLLTAVARRRNLVLSESPTGRTGAGDYLRLRAGALRSVQASEAHLSRTSQDPGRRHRASSPSRSAAFASSRVITPKRARRPFSPLACSGCSTTF